MSILLKLKIAARLAGGLVAAFWLGFNLAASAAPALLLDMTHRNPGEGYPDSEFVNPQFLAGWGYNGQVIGSIGGLQTFDDLAPGLLPAGGAAFCSRTWSAISASRGSASCSGYRSSTSRCW